MSRGRDHDESDRTLGQHVKAELQGLMRMLLKDTVSRSVGLLENDVNVTSFHLPLPAQTEMLALETRDVRVSPDAIAKLRQIASNLPYFDDVLFRASRIKICSGQTFAGVIDSAKFCRPVELIEENVPVLTAPLALSESILPVACKKLAFSLPASFGSVGGWQIEPLKTNRQSQDLALKTTMKSRLVMKRFLPGVRTDARFRQLPILKIPVPPHRFSLDKRQVFRQALASKAVCQPDNVQLVSIFERMAMGRYGGLRQDGQGNLLCVPKSASSSPPPSSVNRHDRAMSRPTSLYGTFSKESAQASKQNSQEFELSYLVIGLRLDTKMEIRAIVPMAQIASLENVPPENGPDSHSGSKPGGSTR